MSASDEQMELWQSLHSELGEAIANYQRCRDVEEQRRLALPDLEVPSHDATDEELSHLRIELAKAQLAWSAYVAARDECAAAIAHVDTLRLTVRGALQPQAQA